MQQRVRTREEPDRRVRKLEPEVTFKGYDSRAGER